ncbi:TIGR04282 family arsenosugar biosynthesis glycosyltransferase [Halofilum ochraceum]|uniref:TIGR04282 family arsenosugar biosynthesis glycosyltransferase n=1 Tax=Halofilum ochraceum TaxID=1611323 RepID=UPI0008DADC7C|nr:TIGR04282 family arsenosugar biosynthesis glycosyltransferase [Halofilum ochraceum]
MNVRIVVFAKAPVPGRAKTRLIPALGPEGAARLQAALLEDALQRARAAGPAGLELWGTGDDPQGCLPAAAARHGASLRDQCDGDLGARMQHALACATADGTPALVIGTDAPGLTPARIEQAGESLARHDAVLVPALDGGYVLLGAHAAPAELFTGIDWGTDRVLAATHARLRTLGWRVDERPVVWDVDEPEDLERVRALGGHWPAYLDGYQGAEPAAD